MTLSEGYARSGLQVPLERERTRLVGELDYDIDVPGQTVRRVCAVAGIMSGNTGRDIRRHPCVIPRWSGSIAENVHESLL